MDDVFTYTNDVLVKKTNSGKLKVESCQSKEDAIKILEEAIELLRSEDVKEEGVLDKIYDLDGNAVVVGGKGTRKYY